MSHAGISFSRNARAWFTETNEMAILSITVCDAVVLKHIQAPSRCRVRVDAVNRPSLAVSPVQVPPEIGRMFALA